MVASTVHDGLDGVLDGDHTRRRVRRFLRTGHADERDGGRVGEHPVGDLLEDVGCVAEQVWGGGHEHVPAGEHLAFGQAAFRAEKVLKPSTIQALLRNLDHLAPRTCGVILTNLSTILSAAVDDELIGKNPCKARSVSKPRPDAKQVVPWKVEDVHGVQDAMPERYQIAVTLGAGLGLRQGEIFGLAADDVDFLRGFVTVRRQVKLYSDGRLEFALPKGRKVRTVPLPGQVRDELAAHLAARPAVPVVLPGSADPVPLVLTTRERTALARTYFNRHVWKKALRAAGVADCRENGMHALRHYYASVLLDGGESIKAVSQYLGHADPGFTLRIYTHLMPSSEERSRRLIDAALSRPHGTDMAHATGLHL